MDTPKVYLSGNFLIHADCGAVDLRTTLAVAVSESSKKYPIESPGGVSFATSNPNPQQTIFWRVADAAERQLILSLFSQWAKMQVPVIAYANEGSGIGSAKNIPHPTGFSPDDFKSMISAPKTQFAQWTSEMTGTPGTSSGKVDYSRFTDRARKVMALANQEAQRFNHEYVAPEHILLGIAVEGMGSAAIALKNLGADLRKVRLEVEKLMKRSPDLVVMGKLPRTPRAAKVIEYAAEENDKWIGTEHLIIGLLRETDSIAFKVLASIGVTIDGVRGELAKILSVAPATPEDPRRKGREFL